MTTIESCDHTDAYGSLVVDGHCMVCDAAVRPGPWFTRDDVFDVAFGVLLGVILAWIVGPWL